MGLFKKEKITKSIIEFVGAPGSGKTTVAVSLAKDLHRRGLNIACNRSLFMEALGHKKKRLFKLLIIYNVITNFFECAQIILLGLEYGFLLKNYKLFRLYLTYITDIASKIDLVLYDQGIINFLATACARKEISSDGAKIILKKFFKKNIKTIISINLPISESLDRAFSRNKNHPIKFLNREDGLDFNKKYSFYVDILLKDLMVDNNISIICVDGAKDVRDNSTFLSVRIISETK